MDHKINSPLRLTKATTGYKSIKKIQSTTGVYNITVDSLKHNAEVRNSDNILVGTASGVDAKELLKYLREGMYGLGASFAMSYINGASYLQFELQNISFSPASGSYVGAQTVTIISPITGVTFYYTLNGSTPTILSTLYTVPILISASQTLRVLAVKDGYADSLISAVYTIGPAALPVNLLTAVNYAVLAKSAITNTTGSVITGDMGISPAAASSITGFGLVLDGGGTFSTSASVIGQVYAADYSAPTPANLTQAVLDMEAAYTNAAGRSPDITGLGAGEIGGLTLVPGVYKWTTGVTISNNVTLSGNGVWIFQISGTLNLAVAKAIILSGGALAENIFWQVAGAVTLMTNSQFKGIILAATNVAVQTNASIVGRALAQTAVTLDDNVITQAP